MFVDANVVLRWILKDHADQCRQVDDLIQASDCDSIIIADVIMGEIYYVLRGKGLDNQQIASVFDDLMENPAFGFDNETRLTRQVEIIRGTTLDFADCYLIARAINSGERLKTFDKAMQKAYVKYKDLPR